MTAGRTVVGQSQDWSTPEKYIDAVRKVFGEIHLDPCSNRWSRVGAITEWRLPQHDGLKLEWQFDTIYVNPPYGSDKVRGTRISDWLAKCAEAHECYGSEIIALVPVAANTLHWKRYIWPKATAISFLYDTRLRFLVNGRDDGKGAPMACAAIYWGTAKRHFANVFGEHGAVVDLANVVIPKTAQQRSLGLLPQARRLA